MRRGVPFITGGGVLAGVCPLSRIVLKKFSPNGLFLCNLSGIFKGRRDSRTLWRFIFLHLTSPLG